MDTDNMDIAAALGNNNTEGAEIWNMSLVDQLTSLDGRINRLRYITTSILFFVVSLIYIVPVGIVLGILWVVSGVPEFVIDFFLGLVMIPVWYCGYAISVKRLQDMNWGDGWITYLQIYTVLCVIWGMTPVGSSIQSILDIITAVMALPLLVCVFVAGEHGPNRFGPAPLNQLPNK